MFAGLSRDFGEDVVYVFFFHPHKEDPDKKTHQQIFAIHPLDHPVPGQSPAHVFMFMCFPFPQNEITQNWWNPKGDGRGQDRKCHKLS